MHGYQIIVVCSLVELWFHRCSTFYLTGSSLAETWLLLFFSLLVVWGSTSWHRVLQSFLSFQKYSFKNIFASVYFRYISGYCIVGSKNKWLTKFAIYRQIHDGFIIFHLISKVWTLIFSFPKLAVLINLAFCWCKRWENGISLFEFFHFFFLWSVCSLLYFSFFFFFFKHSPIFNFF